MNATEATITEEDTRQRGKGNAGRCSQQASKGVYSKSRDIMEKLVAVVHPRSSQLPVSVRKVKRIRKHSAGDIQW